MSNPSSAPDIKSHVLVILLAPELVPKLSNEENEWPHLLAAIKRQGRRVRVLMRINSDTPVEVDMQFRLANDLRANGVEIEILLAASVARWEDATLPITCMPRASNNEDAIAEADAVALALSDVVLADPQQLGEPMARQAVELGKEVLKPGAHLPMLSPGASVTECLDPDSGYWRRPFRYVFGRLEQGLIEILTFDSCFLRPSVIPKRWKGLWNSVRPGRRPVSYFPKQECGPGSPDRKAHDQASPVIERYELLDRAALFGSYIHRDQIWIAHILAAGAVFAAVKGTIEILGGHGREAAGGHIWPMVEFGVLICVAFLIWIVRRSRLHDRWMACRYGAEQLRIARMCLPLLVVPRALRIVDRPQDSVRSSDDGRDMTLRALSEVKRTVRDHGLPRLCPTNTPEQAARWAQFLVHDQLQYHKSNHLKLERAEKRLRHWTGLFFLSVVGAVVLELIPSVFEIVRSFVPISHNSLLLWTAAGPAIPAALHSAATRLGIVHRIALSATAVQDLQVIDDALTDMTCCPHLTEKDWPAIRALTLRAAEAMGQENTSWHGLVRLQRDGLPA